MPAPSPQPDGHLALPAPNAVTAGTVLALHAWWGLNETMKGACARLADSGYVAFAPDLYHGRIADTIAEAEKLSNALDPDQARVDLANAVRFLQERTAPTDRGMAVLAFSLGVWFAMELSVRDPGHIRSVIIFYGTRPGDYGRSQAEYLGHFAEKDRFEPQSSVDEMEADLRRAGRPATFFRYPGTGHWFFEPDRTDAFNPAAASLAWDRTLGFLRRSFA